MRRFEQIAANGGPERHTLLYGIAALVHHVQLPDDRRLARHAWTCKEVSYDVSTAQ